MERKEFIQKIADAGVVGAGGGGFPAAVKLNANFQHYIANGAECEPLLHKDIELMRRYADFLAEAIAIIKNTLGANYAYIGVKEKYTDIWDVLNPSMDKYKIRPHYLDDIFPAGDEFELVRTVLGKTIPPGNIPLAVGAVVNNVETIYNIGKAISREPVISKWLTITGEVEHPFTAIVPLGTQVKYLLNIARPKIENFAIIEGGPMMGNIVDENEPIKKTTAGFIVLPPEHRLITSRQKPIRYILRIAESACMQCQACTDLCPRNLLGHPLEPHKIMRALAMPLSIPLESLTSALICSECGICEQFACPMEISPRRINRELKAKFFENKIKFDWNGGDVDVREERDFRRIPSQKLAERIGVLDYFYIHPEFIPSLPEPADIVLKLKQHAGVPAVPVVKIGDSVSKNQLVAKIPDGKLGANIHSSLDGKVISTSPDIVISSE
ncbi:4Fe-4S dicluster domain-containing protein [bacterium]|nr:4Fe-4S dicluster domain-containing protein [bacterium]